MKNHILAATLASMVLSLSHQSASACDIGAATASTTGAIIGQGIAGNIGAIVGAGCGELAHQGVHDIIDSHRMRGRSGWPSNTTTTEIDSMLEDNRRASGGGFGGKLTIIKENGDDNRNWFKD